MTAGTVRCGTLLSVLAPTVLFIGSGLSAAGTISGTVTDASTGLGFALCIDVSDDTGAWVGTACPGDGVYTSPELDPGTYYVSTNNWTGYYDEVWDDIPCNPMCDVTIGTPVVVGTGNTAGIDFALQPGGGFFAGAVTDASSGNGVAFFPVLVYDATGTQVGFGWCNPPAGLYTTKGALETGTYFAVASPPGYFAELYDDIPCPDGACDPTTGTPINITAGQGTWGIDFSLIPHHIFYDSFESGDTSAWSAAEP
jgi:hypothetical protein